MTLTVAELKKRYLEVLRLRVQVAIAQFEAVKKDKV